MSLSKRARRGISIFSRIQWNPKRAIYLLSQKRMINLEPLPDPKLVTAASEAMEILVKNGEAANAELQAIREQENDTVTPSEEGRAPGDIHVQQNDNRQEKEGGTGGPQ